MAEEPKYGDIDKGKNGPVRKLQTKLKDAGHDPGEIDGKFFDDTLAAVNAFRKEGGLDPIPKPKPEPTKEVKAQPVAKLNLEALPESVATSKGDPTEAGPSIKYLGDDDRRGLFGRFKFTPYPANEAGQVIHVLDDPATGKNWADTNLVTVEIPQLKKMLLNGKPHTSGKVTVHKLIVPQLLAMFEKIEADGMLHYFITYEGAHNPRYIRGSKTSLSNHAYGTALDFNAEWNGMGKEPAKVGEKGSLRELVPYFEAFGFYWGGYFSRKDGMHIEAAKVLGVMPTNVKKA